MTLTTTPKIIMTPHPNNLSNSVLLPIGPPTCGLFSRLELNMLAYNIAEDDNSTPQQARTIR